MRELKMSIPATDASDPANATCKACFGVFVADSMVFLGEGWATGAVTVNANETGTGQGDGASVERSRN